MKPDERECPRCAETIKKRARACGFCNIELPAVAEPPHPMARSHRQTNRKELAQAGCGRLALSALAVGALSFCSRQPAAITQTAEPEASATSNLVSTPAAETDGMQVHYVDATDVAGEFRVDPKAAAAKYREHAGVRWIIKGRIAGLGFRNRYNYELMLGGEVKNRQVGVMAATNEDVADARALPIGQLLAVSCEAIYQDDVGVAATNCTGFG